MSITPATQATQTRQLLANFTFLISSLFAQQSALAAKPDPVLVSFATVGDSRAEPGPHLNRQDQIWLQNTRALSRILREIQVQRPNALFFNGDMVMGYTTDKATFNRQYAYWRGMVANMMETGTYVVPVPGNHEVQERSKDSAGKTHKAASLANENIWRENMGDLIVDTERWKSIVGKELAAFQVDNAPAVGGPDNIQTSQSQLSFSFDFADSHFAVINTDPVGNDGHAPAHWLAEDFKQAKERGTKHYFVFGHKPAYTYFYKADVNLDGLDIYPDNLKNFWDVIESYQAAYFCGHQHIYHAWQPTLATGGKAWQVTVGSGGSPFSAKASDTSKPQDRMYAWAIVKVHASGKVHLDVYGFDEHYGKTQKLKSIYF